MKRKIPYYVHKIECGPDGVTVTVGWSDKPNSTTISHYVGYKQFEAYPFTSELDTAKDLAERFALSDLIQNAANFDPHVQTEAD